ncbi:hypothetical protein [Streptomyces hygroscopicus]|uniref:hypothetical protein n=1 Tax=Streptomyces hygroscopicus TaxID=1912 RepID=UPI003696E5EB
MPVVGSSLGDDLRSLGFDVRTAADAAGVTEEFAAVPAHERVALVDPRFVGHVHALRLALTDPRFPAAATRGALTVQPVARTALTRALAAATHPGETDPGETDPGETAPAGAAGGPERAAVPGADARDGDAGPSGGDAGPSGGAVASGDGHRLGATVRAPGAVHASGEYAGSPSRTRPSGAATALGPSGATALDSSGTAAALDPSGATTPSQHTALYAAACAPTRTRHGFVSAGERCCS